MFFALVAQSHQNHFADTHQHVVADQPRASLFGRVRALIAHLARRGEVVSPR